ncbi:YceI family protein [Marinilabilia salmonicolor]|uniref:YceI-like domain-containing protein n=1 Tax=Marinilabilia salmonicolor TaxID=989 RepID=A0A368VF47_9BACT|nr:YceI family protein [Marinilabilia salmonicolor]RCW38900.1 YceI-like domain-containing protein [Marinilabilia salmonicolor]
MKKLLFVFIIGISFALNVDAQETKEVDVKKSTLTWEAGKIGGSHDGTINLKSGSLVLKDDLIHGGEFVIDMESIAVTDIEDESLNQQLEGHLKSADFFDVENYKSSRFEVVSSSKSGADIKVNGNLTIKGNTNPVTFLAQPTTNGYKARIEVDRTLYDVRYGSKKFFDNLADKAIDDEFFINVELFVK